ncbi:hypothetical protein NSA19_02910 [Actinomyces bowdenii]|uniref:hypothetical protein n=1 Tax=Actinomyces bowdenii TaxID=131109 RepID=UPI00214CCFF6|nr:hypothetical protein [Actinomyces bowdenii]MCR2051819.1 hypothetical protein [Actinomyces bowdenii]
MKMRITAPVEIDGEWPDVGDVIDIQEPGLVSRLLHFGQAVLVEPAPEPEAAGAPAKHKPKEGDHQ